MFDSILMKIDKEGISNETLDFSYVALDEQAIQRLIETIKSHTQSPITTLNLYCCGIHDNELKILLDAFPNLAKAELSCNEISGLGAKYIAGSKISDLKINANPNLGDNGAIALSKSKCIKILHARECNITDPGAKAIFNNKNLTTVDLSGNQITDEGVSELKIDVALRSINLSQCQIGNKGAGHIARCLNLTEVNLDTNSIGDEGAEAFQDTNIVHLNLGQNQITGKGFIALCKNKAIETLSLFNNKISFEDISELPYNDKLKVVRLGFNQIGSKPKQPLMELLAYPNLEELNLDYNQITDIAYPIPYKHYQHGNALKTVSLNGNPLSENKDNKNIAYAYDFMKKISSTTHEGTLYPFAKKQKLDKPPTK